MPQVGPISDRPSSTATPLAAVSNKLLCPLSVDIEPSSAADYSGNTTASGVEDCRVSTGPSVNTKSRYTSVANTTNTRKLNQSHHRVSRQKGTFECYESGTTQVHQISSTTSALMQDIQNLPTVTSLQIQQADPSLEQDKKSIYGHPLYPLVSLLLEKCESATAQPDLPSPDTFDADMRAFVQRQEADQRPFFTDDQDLDSLMVKAIQVLRIHLIEIRKVNELCNDFCSRYINCLKSKIQSDILLQDSAPSSPTGSEALSPSMGGPGGNGYHPGYLPGPGGGVLGPHSLHQLPPYVSGANTNAGVGDDGLSPSSGGDQQHYHHMQHYLHGSGHHHHRHHHESMSSAELAKQKRGVLPKRATQVMKQWLFQHLVHPYPTEDEKRQLASATNLTLLQVNNWFINARRRILQPMLDASNPIGGGGDLGAGGSGGGSKTGLGGGGHSLGNKKKKSSSNRPTNNRFWPASLAAAAVGLSNSLPGNPNTTISNSASSCGGGVARTTTTASLSSASAVSTGVCGGGDRSGSPCVKTELSPSQSSRCSSNEYTPGHPIFLASGDAQSDSPGLCSGLTSPNPTLPSVSIPSSLHANASNILTETGVHAQGLGGYSTSLSMLGHHGSDIDLYHPGYTANPSTGYPSAAVAAVAANNLHHHAALYQQHHVHHHPHQTMHHPLSHHQAGHDPMTAAFLHHQQQQHTPQHQHHIQSHHHHATSLDHMAAYTHAFAKPASHF